MASTINEVFGIICMVTLVPLGVVLTIWFYHRREIQPIKARSPVLVTITNIMWILWAISLSFQRIFNEDFPCVVIMWQGYVGMLVIANIYLMRSWILYFNFTIAQMMSRTETMHDFELADVLGDEGRRNIRDAKMNLSSSFLVRFNAVAATLVLLTPLVYTIFDGDIRYSKGDSCDRVVPDVILGVIAITYAVVFIVFSFRLRSVVDGFQIKQELSQLGICFLFVIIPWVLLHSIEELEDFNDNEFPISTLLMMLAILFVFYRSNIVFIKATYQNKGQPTDLISMRRINDLSTIIDHDEGFKAFKEFLTSEFSVENLLFWKTVEQYRTDHSNADVKKLVSYALKIQETYLNTDSLMEVNISSRDRKNTTIELRKIMDILENEESKKDLSKVHHDLLTLFDIAQNAVYRLMETDAFPRYIVSRYHHGFTRKMTAESARNDALKQLDVL